jgi:hypothetical protein
LVSTLANEGYKGYEVNKEGRTSRKDKEGRKEGRQGSKRE